MEWIEFVLDLVHYEPQRSGQPPSLVPKPFGDEANNLPVHYNGQIVWIRSNLSV